MDYKLIQTYPSIFKIGDIAKFDGTGCYKIFRDNVYISNEYISVVQDFPEYWEKVVEKNYEVLLYQNPDNKLLYTVATRQDIWCQGGTFRTLNYCQQHYKIYSVKRLSDGEIFTIGDLVKYGNASTKIIEFEIIDKATQHNWMSIGVKYGSGGIDLTLAQKAKIHLFTTEDGVDIFKNNHPEIYWIDIKSYEIGIDKKDTLNDPILHRYKYFSTKEKAEGYALMNKPGLSIIDVLKLNQQMGTNSNGQDVLMSELIKLVKSKNDTK